MPSLSRFLFASDAAVLRLSRRSSIQTICRHCNPSRPYSSAPNSLLTRLRDDLKTAMRNKDKPRLNVLRGVLADITNLSKTNSPVKDDLGLLTLLKKRMGAVKQALQQAEEVSRNDLAEKEKEQLDVLQEYAGNIKTLDNEEIRKQLLTIVEELRSAGQEITTGSIMKKCFIPGGVFDGQLVEKSAVARIIKEVATS